MAYDIIIPWQTDLHRGLELKYCLRSIDKYLTGYRKIIIVGDLPAGITTDYIPASDIINRKEQSIMRKIMLAAKHPDVTEDFVMWHDDHFLMRPLSCSDIKYWYDEPLPNLLNRNPKGYGATIRHTITNLEEAGRPDFNYDIHTPIIFNKQKFIDVNERLCKWDKEYLIKSLYCNHTSVEGTQMKDCKINSPLTPEKIKDHIAGRLFFSTGPVSLVGAMVQVFEEMYPEKSRWEK